MKTSLPLRSLRLLAACGSAGSAALLHAQTPITWADSAGNTDWATGSSWVGGTAPASSAVNFSAIFTTVNNAQPVLAADRSIHGIDFQMADGGVNFTSGAGVTLGMGAAGIDATGQLSGTNTVSVENITLNGNPTWTLFSGTSSESTSTFTVNSNINVNGQGWVVTPNRNSALGNSGIVQLNGVISGTFASAGFQLFGGSFRNTVQITGLNTYTGNTFIRGMEVVANSIGNAGQASALGQSGNIVIGYNNSTASLQFKDLAADGITDRQVLFRGSATSNYSITNNSATGRLSFNNTGDIGNPLTATSNALTVRFAGSNTELNTFAQILDDRANSGVTKVRKEGAGTWVLSGINTYTGTTAVVAGKLFINGDQTLATGAVDVTSDAILGGTGTVGGAVTLTGTGQLAPGVDGIGRLTLGAGLAVNNGVGGGLTFEIGGAGGVKGTDFDSLVVSGGSVSLGGGASLSIVAFNGFNLFQTGSYDLYDFASTPTGDFNSVSVAGTLFANNSGTWTGSVGGYDFTFLTGTGVLSAVTSSIPEPASLGLLVGFSVLGGAALRRRRRC